MNLSALIPQNVTSTASAAATLSREGLRVRSGVRAGVLYVPYLRSTQLLDAVAPATR